MGEIRAPTSVAQGVQMDAGRRVKAEPKFQLGALRSPGIAQAFE